MKELMDPLWTTGIKLCGPGGYCIWTYEKAIKNAKCIMVILKQVEREQTVVKIIKGSNKGKIVTIGPAYSQWPHSIATDGRKLWIFASSKDDL